MISAQDPTAGTRAAAPELPAQRAKIPPNPAISPPPLQLPGPVQITALTCPLINRSCSFFPPAPNHPAGTKKPASGGFCGFKRHLI